MAVRIRLRRTGGKQQPSYRIVVADSRSPRDGRFLENIGNYNPRTDPATVAVDAERARFWLSKGALPTDAVARLLEKNGLFSGRKLRYSKPKAEAPAAGPAAPPKPAAQGA